MSLELCEPKAVGDFLWRNSGTRSSHFRMFAKNAGRFALYLRNRTIQQDKPAVFLNPTSLTDGSFGAFWLSLQLALRQDF